MTASLLTPLAVDAHRRRCRATTWSGTQEQGHAISPPTRPASGGDHRGDARGWRWRARTARLERSSPCSGAPGFGSPRRSHSPSPTSIRDAGRCSCATARATSAARPEWTTGASSTSHDGSQRRVELPVGPLFCVIDGSTRGRAWSATAVRAELRRLAVDAGVRRRFAPHQLRHAHAVELAREGIAVNLIQRQLGHTDLGTTSTYLRASTRPRSSTPCTRGARR